MSTETHWKCIPCSKRFHLKEQLGEHEKSKKHKKKVKEYLQKHPDESQSSLFKSINIESSNGSILGALAHSLTSGNDARTVEEDDMEKVPVRTTLESQRICLFCNLESDGVKKNLDHMRQEHNFVILDIECLINLKGLISYIAERI